MNLKMLKEATQSQLDVLRCILQLEKEKYEYLLAGKLQDFSTINQKLSQKLETLEIAEIQRRDTLKEFVLTTGLFKEGTEVRFSDIVKSLEGTKEHEPMKIMYEEMGKIVDKIKYYTTINKDLIETALNVLSITLGQQDKEIDYTKRSETKESHSLLVNKVI